MTDNPFAFGTSELRSSLASCGSVTRIDDDGSVTVRLDDETMTCDRLCDPDGTPIRLEVADTVLVVKVGGPTARGVVIGRVATPEMVRVHHLEEVAPPAVPQNLTIEAGERMTLRVGEASIEIRGDGKILIKGKDLVSHATSMNRVKGGAVAIN